VKLSRSEIAYGEAMKKLFTAQWNIPQAATALGKPASEESWDETKELFREYCLEHTPIAFNAG
jgi:hypothetical protein